MVALVGVVGGGMAVRLCGDGYGRKGRRKE
jgi:hypothetical protein